MRRPSSRRMVEARNEWSQGGQNEWSQGGQQGRKSQKSWTSQKKDRVAVHGRSQPMLHHASCPHPILLYDVRAGIFPPTVLPNPARYPFSKEISGCPSLSGYAYCSDVAT